MARRGYTLTEVLIVIGLIGILVSIALPAILSVRGVALRSSCQNQLRQLATAVHHYEQANGVLPVANRLRRHRYGEVNPGGLYPPAVSWLTFLTPHVDQSDVYLRAVSDLHIEANPLRNPPHSGLEAVIQPFACPADGRVGQPQRHLSGVLAGFTSYLGVEGTWLYDQAENPYNGVLLDGADTVRMTDVSDGASATLMIGERPPNDRYWAGIHYTHYIFGQPAAEFPDVVLKVEAMAPSYPIQCRSPAGNRGGYIGYGPGRTDNDCDLFHFWSLHSAGSNFAYADGSVRFLSYAVSTEVMRALASRNGGEAQGNPE